MPLDTNPGFSFNPGQERVWGSLYTTACRFCLVYGGSRSGKTFLTVFAILVRALKAPASKHLIVRQEGAAATRALARGNMATIPVVLKLCFPGVEAVWNEKYSYFVLPNKSEIWIGGLNDEKAMERVLGNEYASIYINEASEVRYSAFTLLRSRLAQVCHDEEGGELFQRFYVDLNPTTRMHWTYRLWQDGVDPESNEEIDRSKYGFEILNPYDNAQNLTGDYLADLAALPELARKRFLEGAYVSDDDRALWRRDHFKRVQLKEDGRMPVDMRRIVVAIDPAASSEPGSDEHGIVTVGLGVDKMAYVLSDDSLRGKPEDWARKAVASYERFNADLIVAEKNNGGDMVEATIRAHAPLVNYAPVWASRGKVTRAEPVAALYELGKVMHLDGLSTLEDQMCSFTSHFDRQKEGWSPDRVDALVWAITELFPEMSAAPTRSGPLPIPKVSMA